MRPEQPIRVLLTVPHLSSTAHPYRLMMSIARYLPRDEFSLTICSLRANGYEDTAPLLRGMGIEPFVARYRPRRQSTDGILHSLSDQALIRRRGRFDVQHSLDFTSSPFESVMARLRRRPFVCSQCNLAEDSSRRMLRVKIRFANRIVAISSAVRELLLQNGADPERVRLIMFGIELPEDKYLAAARPRASDETFTVLCVGQIQRRKRQEDAIRAVAALRERVPRVCLDIVGSVHDLHYQRDLERMVDELGVAAHVRFLGERKDVIEMMREADALVHCAASEAFGWVIVEAMSVGLPTVLSNAEGPGEIVEPGTGILVPIGDVCGFAGALAHVLEDRSAAQTMAASARAMVERRFSERAMVERYAEVYRELGA
jgi:glycosyltransferase involved in cell wall biosynthesis